MSLRTKIIIGSLSLILAAQPVEAAFWSNWLKKEPVKVEVKEEPVDEQAVEKRLQTVQNIFTGRYRGPGVVELSFTEAELKKVVWPLIQPQLKGAPIKNLDAYLTDGAVVFTAYLEQPVKGNWLVELAPKVSDGKLLVEIRKVKFGWLTVPGFIIKQVITKVSDQRLDQPIALPGFKLTAVTIKNKQLDFKGEVVKKK